MGFTPQGTDICLLPTGQADSSGKTNIHLYRGDLNETSFFFSVFD